MIEPSAIAIRSTIFVEITLSKQSSEELDIFEKEVKKIDEVNEYLLEMRNLAPSMRTMPVVLKGNNLIGGYSDLVEYFS